MRRIFILALLALAWAAVYLGAAFASDAMPYGTFSGGSLAPRVEVLSSRLDGVHLRLTTGSGQLPSQIDLEEGVEGLRSRNSIETLPFSVRV